MGCVPSKSKKHEREDQGPLDQEPNNQQQVEAYIKDEKPVPLGNSTEENKSKDQSVDNSSSSSDNVKGVDDKKSQIHEIENVAAVNDLHISSDEGFELEIHEDTVSEEKKGEQVGPPSSGEVNGDIDGSTETAANNERNIASTDNEPGEATDIKENITVSDNITVSNEEKSTTATISGDGENILKEQVDELEAGNGVESKEDACESICEEKTPEADCLKEEAELSSYVEVEAGVDSVYKESAPEADGPIEDVCEKAGFEESEANEAVSKTEAETVSDEVICETGLDEVISNAHSDKYSYEANKEEADVDTDVVVYEHEQEDVIEENLDGTQIDADIGTECESLTDTQPECEANIDIPKGESEECIDDPKAENDEYIDDPKAETDAYIDTESDTCIDDSKEESDTCIDPEAESDKCVDEPDAESDTCIDEEPEAETNACIDDPKAECVEQVNESESDAEEHVDDSQYVVRGHVDDSQYVVGGDVDDRQSEDEAHIDELRSESDVEAHLDDSHCETESVIDDTPQGETESGIDDTPEGEPCMNEAQSESTIHIDENEATSEANLDKCDIEKLQTDESKTELEPNFVTSKMEAETLPLVGQSEGIVEAEESRIML